MPVDVAVAVSVTVRHCWQVDDLAMSHPSGPRRFVGVRVPAGPDFCFQARPSPFPCVPHHFAAKIINAARP